jgi:dTDP-4-amino-4,6-dideoxygalactose transaminase
MPNINAAIGCAQMERLGEILSGKRRLADAYSGFCERAGLQFVREPDGCRSNYWLNAVLLDDQTQRDEFLNRTNDAGVMTRPLWEPLHRLPMFKDRQAAGLENSEWLAARLVAIPSGVKWAERNIE